MESPAAAGGRILHLGLGAFHRAHQAVFLQALHDLGDRTWTLAGGNLRPDDAATLAALRQSGGAYTLETVAPDGTRSYQRITAIQQVLPWEPDLASVIATGADPATRIVSFTVTEAGYGPLLFGALAAILRLRMQQGAGPVTLLSCDNLRHNGDRSRAGLLEFIEANSEPALLDWVRANTTSPNAMVDRITPRPAPEVAARVKAATGVDDPAALMAESFLQWVVEDRFAAGRPAWDKAGVQLVADVTPYEEAKIRLLNATHSCIGWAGVLAGHRYVHEGARDPRVRRFAFDYATNDAIPALEPSPLDLAAYRDSVLDRFGNAAIVDTNQRIVMDSFAKIPAFIVPTFRDRLAQGASIASVAVLPALFLAFLRRWHQGRLPFAHQDQAMDEALGHALCEAADPVAAFVAVEAVWGPLAGDSRVVDAIRQAGERIQDFVQPA
jgi:D-arabinitol 4-dehydrogenase